MKNTSSHFRLHWHWYMLLFGFLLFGGWVISQNVAGGQCEITQADNKIWCFRLYKKGTTSSAGGKLDSKSAVEIHGSSYDIASGDTEKDFFLPTKSKMEYLSFVCASGNYAK